MGKDCFCQFFDGGVVECITGDQYGLYANSLDILFLPGISAGGNGIIGIKWIGSGKFAA